MYTTKSCYLNSFFKSEGCDIAACVNITIILKCQWQSSTADKQMNNFTLYSLLRPSAFLSIYVIIFVTFSLVREDMKTIQTVTVI